MKGLLGFCQLITTNKKYTNTQWNNFLRVQCIQRRLIRISLLHPSLPSPSLPPMQHYWAGSYTHSCVLQFLQGTNIQWTSFQKAHQDSTAPPLLFLPLPSPPCNTTGLAVTHTHVKSSSFKVEFTFSASPMASAPSFPNPFHARFTDLMVIFSCRKQEQHNTIQIMTPLHIKIPSSFKLIMDY